MSSPCDTRTFEVANSSAEGGREFFVTGWTDPEVQFVAFDVEWYDGPDFRALCTNLTPRQATSIAIGLLQAADDAEGLDE